MPKSQRQYHNLEGLIRDIKAALINGHTSAYELAELIIELDDLIVVESTSSVDGTEDDPNDALDGNQGDLALLHTGASAEGPAGVGGPLARSSGDRTPASLLDGILDYVPGHLRAQAVAELDELRRDALGASGRGLTRPTNSCTTVPRGVTGGTR